MISVHTYMYLCLASYWPAVLSWLCWAGTSISGILLLGHGESVFGLKWIWEVVIELCWLETRFYFMQCYEDSEKEMQLLELVYYPRALVVSNLSVAFMSLHPLFRSIISVKSANSLQNTVALSIESSRIQKGSWGPAKTSTFLPFYTPRVQNVLGLRQI